MRKQLDDSPGLRAYAATWTKAHGQSTAGHAHADSEGGPHRCMHRARRLHAVAWVKRLRTTCNRGEGEEEGELRTYCAIEPSQGIFEQRSLQLLLRMHTPRQ